MSVGHLFKIGDRVRIAEKKERHYGEEFTVTAVIPPEAPRGGGLGYVNGIVNGEYITVHFYEVTLIAPAPTTSGPYMAQHHPDGTLTLTPVQEAEKVEERREPEFGEVWQMRDERLVLIASDHRTDFRPWPIVLNHEGTGPVIPAEETYATRALGAGNLTFAYSSLAAAVAAGAIK